MYPPEIVLPMKAELTENGFQDCNTPDAVKEAMAKAKATNRSVAVAGGGAARRR